MTTRIVIAGILGGIIVYAWSFVSWTLLPWHEATLSPFKDEEAVKKAILAGAPETGIYVLPYMDMENEGGEPMEPPEEFVFAAVTRGGTRGFAAMYGLSVVGDIIAALIVAWLLARSRETGFIGRVRFVKLIAFAAAVICLWPNWLWWQFETWFMVVAFLDVMIAWGLAGTLMALIVRPPPAPEASATEGP